MSLPDPPPPPPERPPLTPEQIERMRQTGLRLDREGRFWHEGTRVTHPGLARALLRWLDRLPDGRPILRLDERRYAYLEVEDAHLLVRSLTWRDDRAWLTLNDGSEEELAYESLRRAEDHALYCKVREGTLWARLTTPAYYALAEHIVPVPGTRLDDPEDGPPLHARSDGHDDDPESDESGDASIRFALHARDQYFPIAPWTGLDGDA